MRAIEQMKSVRIQSPFISGLLYSFITLAILTSMLAISIHWGLLAESKLDIWTYIVHGIAVLFGGFIAGRRAKKRGWYAGGILGLMYTLMLCLVGFLGFNASLSTSTFVLFSFCGGIGALGGIFGVNTASD